jgi:hypothetical protein
MRGANFPPITFLSCCPAHAHLRGHHAARERDHCVRPFRPHATRSSCRTARGPQSGQVKVSPRPFPPPSRSQPGPGRLHSHRRLHADAPGEPAGRGERAHLGQARQQPGEHRRPPHLRQEVRVSGGQTEFLFAHLLRRLCLAAAGPFAYAGAAHVCGASMRTHPPPWRPLLRRWPQLRPCARPTLPTNAALAPSPSPLVRALPPIPPQHPPPELPVRGRGQAPREHHGPEGGGVRRRVRRRPGRRLPGRPQDLHARAQAPQEQGRRAEGHRLRREPGRHGRAGPQEARGAAAQVKRACSRWMGGQSPSPPPSLSSHPPSPAPPRLPAPTRRSASTSSSWARTT